MIIKAFDLSEKESLPVLMRVTTRMAHSRAEVMIGESRAQNPMKFPDDPSHWVLLPAIARRRNMVVTEQQKVLEQCAVESAFNRYEEGTNHHRGVVACGIAYNYLRENYPNGCDFPVLKLSQYPLPKALIRRMAEECDEILVLEDGQPFVEDQLLGTLPAKCRIRGRMSGDVPRTGELTPGNVRLAMGMPAIGGFDTCEHVVPRPPALCNGCGHRDMYEALNRVVREYKDYKVFSDIGCYTLGALPPFRAIHTCVDMGASITMAKGAADSGLWPAVAVIGDSTFTHSGMTGLLDAVNANANMTVVISDNLTTAMTGGQDSAGTNRLEAICTGLGVDPAHVRVVVPLPKNMEAITAIMREEIEYRGLSVIIPRRECIQTAKRHHKEAQATKTAKS